MVSSRALKIMGVKWVGGGGLSVVGSVYFWTLSSGVMLILYWTTMVTRYVYIDSKPVDDLQLIGVLSITNLYGLIFRF